MAYAPGYGTYPGANTGMDAAAALRTALLGADSSGYTPDNSSSVNGKPSIYDVQRRQALAKQLLANQAPAVNPLGVIANGLAGALSGYENKEASTEQQLGFTDANQQLAQALKGGTGDPATFASAVGNPFLPAPAAGAANDYMQNQMALDKPVPISGYDTGVLNQHTGEVTPIEGGNNSLSPDALSMAAEQYLAGDKSVLSGYARNPMMKAQLVNAIANLASSRGMDGGAIAAQASAYGGNVAAQKAAGTRAAQVGMAASEANQMAGLALDASKNVPRGSFVPWNQAIQMFQSGTSDPNLAKFVAATTSLVNAYARAVSPVGQPTDSQRAHAEQMLNNAQSPEAYAAVISQMQKEMVAALNAPAEISNQLKANVGGGSPPTSSTPAGASTVLTYNPATGQLE